VVETARREPREAPDGRLMSFLLSSPVSDGGRWDVVANLIRKWGLVPKEHFPDAFSCENSRHMNDILALKVRNRCKNSFGIRKCIS
jgi:bleomycin hydrolase